MFPLVFFGALALANPYEDLPPHRTCNVLRAGSGVGVLVRAATGSEEFPEYQVEIGDRNTGEKTRVGGTCAGRFGLRATWDAQANESVPVTSEPPPDWLVP